MDTRDKLKSAIVEWQESELPVLYERKCRANIDVPHINDIMGVRRCGKTYYMYQLISSLLDEGVPRSNILYINLDDDRLHPLHGDELALLIDTFRELYEISKNDKLYLFLDEIQNFPGWEQWIKGVYDKKKNVKFIISGSNASMLSKDISTLLTGRHLTTRMFPFSFTEFLSSQKISFDIETLQFSEKKIDVKRKFNEYIGRGGFPEVIFYPSIDHRDLLQSYFDDIIYRDIISRYKVRNPSIFKELALFCISNIAKPHTYKSLRKLFSSHTSLSTDAIINYISYLEDAFLLFTINHYDASLKKQINKPKKLYCIDLGLINAVSFRFSDDLGRLYENLVFIQLLRSGEEIYYWQDSKGSEVDFVTKVGLDPTCLIQVCTDISDQKTREREINGLVSAMEHFGLQEGTIITSDLFDQDNVAGRTINYLPLWYWLLINDVVEYECPAFSNNV
ncbi:MAG: ATP-binding protein [Euryarchaeota archaeon]|nr:ATP-binding protein [Euryarchaeota archaeon]